MVQKLPEVQKLIVLIWDEISLDPHLIYDFREDRVKGFREWGKQQRSEDIADHALAFMIKGLQSGWKIQISHGFCSATMPTHALKQAVRDNVRALKNAGLKTICSTKDQGGTNQAAVREFIQETNSNIREKNSLEKRKSSLF